MLKKHGLEEKRDYTMLEGPLPAMPAMLLEKKADFIPAVLPFSFNPKLKEEGKVLFEQREALGVTQMIVWTARKSFIDKNRAAMVDFMEDMLRITRWYQDPKNHDEVAKIASNLTKVPPERFGWLFTKQDTFRDPNLIPNVEALQRNVDVTHDLGFVKKKIDIKNYVDFSLVQEAAKRPEISYSGNTRSGPGSSGAVFFFAPYRVLQLGPLPEQIVINGRELDDRRVLGVIAREFDDGHVHVEQKRSLALVADHALRPEK